MPTEISAFQLNPVQCNWEVEDSSPAIIGNGPKVSATGEVSTEAPKLVRVSYITEQTSHHPPVSAFWVDCPVKGISARGFDQLSAKFTGTSVRVTPGAHNLGIFINLQHRDNEEYRLTHPVAHLAGMLRGSLSVTVADTCYITCPKSRIKVILHYLEEGWLGKAQNRVLGVIFQYDPDNDSMARIKDVPEKDVLARIDGCWQDQVRYTMKDTKVMPSKPHGIVTSQDLRLSIDCHPAGVATADRPQSSLAHPKDHPAGNPTTHQRKSPLLARRHGSHSHQAVRPSDEDQTGVGGTPKGESHFTQGARFGVDTAVLHGSFNAQREAGADRRWDPGAGEVTGRRLPSRGKRYTGRLKASSTLS